MNGEAGEKLLQFVNNTLKKLRL